MEKNTSKSTIDIAIIAVISLFSFYLFGRFDVLEKIVEFSSEYERFEIDEMVSTFIVLVFCLVWFSIRRWHEKIKINDRGSKYTHTPTIKIINTDPTSYCKLCCSV